MQPSPKLEYRYVRRRWHVLFAVVDAIGAWCANLWARVAGRSPEGSIPREAARVLVVQLDHLGDAVMTTSILPALRRQFPQAQIDVLAAPWNGDVFAGRTEIHRIYLSRHNRFRRGGAWLWPFSLVYWACHLRRRRYDVAIDVRGDFTIGLLMRLSGARRRVGWPCAGGGFLLTDRVDYVAGRHEVESRHAVLRALGVEVRHPAAPTFAPTTDADRFITHMLGDFRRGVRPLLVFHIGAGTAAKTWPAEHWRELIGRSIVELDARILLVGGGSEVDTARAITHDQFWPGVMDWTGRLTLDHLAALARRASLFVGADSGPAHLAAAAGAEVLVLFSGAADPRQWRPWGDRVRVLKHDVPCAPCFLRNCRFAAHPCLTELLPTAVVEAMRDLIDAPQIVPMPKYLAGRVERPGEAT
jgi:ADP-heptose:LPS heptosyltransferase